MSFYNGILNHDDDDNKKTIIVYGKPGIGFKLDDDNNFDIDNKKLTNVESGENNNDVMTKSKIEGYVNNKTIYLDTALPAKVVGNKACIYSHSGGVHCNGLYIRDEYQQETHIYNDKQDDNQIRLYIPNLHNNDSYGNRLKSSIVVTSINQTIEGKKIFHDIEVPTPTIDGNASNKAYVDNEITKISDNYVRKSGDSMIGSLIVPKDNYPIQGNLNKVLSYETQREIFLSKKEGGRMNQAIDMNGNSIDNLPLPTTNDHACNKEYVDNKMNHLPSLFVDRQGKSKMLGNLNMNNHLIQNVKDPDNTDDCANKKYVDSQISKANIKPSHTPKNAFKYLMDDVNEWSSEYNIKVLSFSDLAESPHSWDKRVLNITPVKDGKNYRFRLGLQMFPMKTNETYSLIVELYNRDFKTWGRQETYVEATGIWLKSHNTTKFQHQYGSSGDLYYSKTLIKFKKTSSSAPVFVYYTVHFDDKGGDMNTYPSEFKKQVYIVAYGIVGEADYVDSEVYDAHEAFEIDKTKMKMLVPLDMNGKQLMNVNFNLKFGDIFKIIKCHTVYSHNRSFFVLARKDNNQFFSFSVGVYINSMTFHNNHSFDKNATMTLSTIGLSPDYVILLSNELVNTGPVRHLTPWLEFSRGLRNVKFINLKNNIRSPFDVDVIVSYM